ncbi:unnamed protein product [Lota lota]
MKEDCGEISDEVRESLRQGRREALFRKNREDAARCQRFREAVGSNGRGGVWAATLGNAHHGVQHSGKGQGSAKAFEDCNAVPATSQSRRWSGTAEAAALITVMLAVGACGGPSPWCCQCSGSRAEGREWCCLPENGIGEAAAKLSVD